MKELVQKKIIAMLPYYTEEGANFTQIKLLNGEDVIFRKTINSTLKCLCEFYHYDLNASNKTCAEILGVKKTPPISINNDMVFIAVKTRIPIGKDDGAYSYINIEMIKNVLGEIIYFKNGDNLQVSCTHKTIEKAIKQASLLKIMINNRQMITREEETNYITEEEILKRDLDIIYKKLLRIEKTIFR